MLRCSVSSIVAMALLVFALYPNNGGCKISKKTNRYMAHIFKKYGSQGAITFEGLEHLMHNLGLGGLEFSPTHTVDHHRPEGFRLPDIVIEPDVIFTTNTVQLEQSTQQSQTIADQSTTLDPINDDVTTESVDNSVRNVLAKDMWNSDLWQDIDFKQMHDPKHRHPRNHDHGLLTTTCMTPASLLRFVVDDHNMYQQSRHSPKRKRDLETAFEGSKQLDRNRRSLEHDDHDHDHDNKIIDEHELLSTVKITPSMFTDICPALLVQLDQRACSDVVKVELGKQDKAYLMAWIYSTISILIISVCGLAGVAIVPLAKSMAYKDILRFLVAIAVGTLCGDALMHLIPHALSPHTHDGSVSMSLFADGNTKNEPVWLCACAFGAAIFMFMLETMLPLFGQKSSHHHGHSHSTTMSKNVAADRDVDPKLPENITMLERNEIDFSNMPLKKKKKLSPVAMMVLLGDGLHNITDGMAIGAAFALDPVTGMATALAVLCHELPHELGDFALLLQTGVSIRKALVFNVFSSILSVGGMIAGLVIAGVQSSFVRWIYAGTSGTFLYIALADLVPEMRRAEDDGSVQSFRKAFTQVIGILAGGGIMLAIALHEDKLRVLFQ